MDRSVLIIDDDSSLLALLRTELELRKYQVATQTSPEGALQLLADHDFGVVLSDISLEGMSGVDLCREVVTLRQDTPVIVMTAFATLDSAIASIRAGAYDFVTKPFDMDDLALTIERAIAHRDLREEVKLLRRAAGERAPFDEIVGQSAAMKRVFDVVARVAETEATVLVTGESGTGKELVARAVHARSGRSAGPFVAINCAAMPEPLLESELFGHVKGAFTDARTSRQGLFLAAAGGTLFLDEIGEMPLGMQAKLLRALQERRVRPVGGNEEARFDARIVAATSRDLEEEIQQRLFREDLFYRINVVHVHVPPLRERDNDVLLLAQTFLQRSRSSPSDGRGRVVGFTKAAAERLASYPWPGNVRELQNCIERALALARFDHVGVDDLPERIGQYTAPRLGVEISGAAPTLSLEEVERRYVMQVLQSLGGNKAAAARTLGLDRRTLYRMLERWQDAPAGGDGAREPGRAPWRRTDAAAC